MEYRKFEDRASYEARQIAASASKFSYCKVSYRDAEKYARILARDRASRGDTSPIGPVLCLGVRNGREVDLLRIALHGPRLLQVMANMMERRWHGFASRRPFIERLNRSNCKRLDERACIGVEINPLAGRPDVWVGSFDNLPTEWTGAFGAVYSNSLDHAYAPYSVAAAWRAVLRPGGYLILGVPGEQRAAPIDPVGLLVFDDVLKLFPGELIYFRRRGSAWRYTEYIIRMR
ncbi:MAG: hypothetical protein FI707_14310 [SAR202 cluster bacterium]|jgi:hypothetical protein|nr:hypothetical protein [Acidobacteriota bacterium]MDP6421772.1 hypothetical protein [SAR202 cluster bacterium]HAL47871.1 hypothetical protein [Dehalococcoidia bacterium]MDP6663267.1 hypothetical protein [SAR202 cluster bacterium]MQG56402.1 hypothetical protein [SAR202 cluster bacterium]|tara:strand:- start:12983 stop:13678 length:696 start_codon:yes stop_codon:yes gene_type:complete